MSYCRKVVRTNRNEIMVICSKLQNYQETIDFVTMLVSLTGHQQSCEKDVKYKRWLLCVVNKGVT